jgi:hypothetical protein
MPQTGTADPGVFEGGHTSSFEGYGVASALS